MAQKIARISRSPGRPRRPATDEVIKAGSLDRLSIVECALEMTRTQSLSEISIVRLAASLGVRPGTIHYHLGSRDNLISAVMNRFYGEILKSLDAGRQAPAWTDELRRYGKAWLDAKLNYAGVASYVASNDRFRVFQKPAEGEEDHGARFMDRLFSLLSRAGFAPKAAAQCWHLMALYINATAQTIALKHAPAEHSSFLLDRAQRFSSADFPGLAFALPALAHLDAMAAFQRSFDDLIEGYQRQIDGCAVKTRGQTKA